VQIWHKKIFCSIARHPSIANNAQGPHVIGARVYVVTNAAGSSAATLVEKDPGRQASALAWTAPIRLAPQPHSHLMATPGRGPLSTVTNLTRLPPQTVAAVAAKPSAAGPGGHCPSRHRHAFPALFP